MAYVSTFVERPTFRHGKPNPATYLALYHFHLRLAQSLALADAHPALQFSPNPKGVDALTGIKLALADGSRALVEVRSSLVDSVYPYAIVVYQGPLMQAELLAVATGPGVLYPMRRMWNTWGQSMLEKLK